MIANQLFLIILIISAIASLAIHVASIKWGLRWAGVADVSFVKALGLLFVFIVAGLLVGLLAGVMVGFASRNPNELTLNLVGFGSQFLAACIVIAMVYKVRWTRAAKAFVPYALVSIAMVLVALFIVRPLAYEAFYIPTNAMAPTLLGEHLEAPCPKCGAPAYGSQPDPMFELPSGGISMVCSNEMQSVHVSPLPQTNGGGDRILVSKLLTPRRWDMIVFRYPEDPAMPYVMRLVGLPGEKLEIRDYAVWIDGEKLDPPESIRGIPYSPTIESSGRMHSGPGSVPIELGPGEYFVLGDFVDQSADSRFWQQGAPGHPPYAVPNENVVGVVINIYWPPSRWTSSR